MHPVRRYRALGAQVVPLKLTKVPQLLSSVKDNTAVETSIEGSLGRLESIVEEIEQTPPPLETLIERYEEGMKLLQICREKLDAAEKRIEIITRNSRGEVALKPFEES